MAFFGIGFATPWLLSALVMLPVLWWLLRAVPPAPKRLYFPAVTLLLGLRDDDSLSDRTPWWLMLLRMIIVAAAIIGLSGPVLNPQAETSSRTPLLLVLDSTWAGAPNWTRTQEELDQILTSAGRAERPVALLRLTAPEPVVFQSANRWQQQIVGAVPLPWSPAGDSLTAAQDAITALDGPLETLWFSDGLDFPGRRDLVDLLSDKGAVTVYQHPTATVALHPVRTVDGTLDISVTRAGSGPGAAAEDSSQISAGTAPGQSDQITVLARGPDPNGTPRTLGSVTIDFATAQSPDIASARLSMPAELRARVRQFQIQGIESAGATVLSDDSLQRRKVALISSQSGNEGLALLSPLHYLRKALEPTATILDGGLTDLLPANPDVIVLADTARLPTDLENQLIDWIDTGGVLLRFAGPKLAASDAARESDTPLLPVRLRAGGRSVGGAMSWGEEKTLAPFRETSSFFGLAIPPDVTVSSQVVAQPDPDLADRVIAELSDGTPLVTRKAIGAGQVVLFHVTANAEWSSLPLSGLFVQMLERLSIASGINAPTAIEMEGSTWSPVQVLDGFGTLQEADALPGVAGPDLITATIGPDLRPGLYQNGDRQIARNILQPDERLQPATWPSSIPVNRYGTNPETDLSGLLLSLALIALALDAIATLALSGKLRRGSSNTPRPSAGQATLTMAMLGLLLVGLLLPAGKAQAQDTAQGTAPTSAAPNSAAQDQSDLDNSLAALLASELTLAHVITGDSRVDQLARDGLRGLSNTLRFRTSVEPAEPVGVDLNRDELSFFPILYWPVTANQKMPSGEAYDRLNTYLRTGGMILFDTRDADLTLSGASSAAGRRLQQLALRLDIPPLEPVPRDHVLTRTFYLLQDFPGRHTRGTVWVEAAPEDAEQIEGLPFRNLNDGVTPVIIGGNDWAGAWAIDTNGRPLLPVGRGYAGERQRELANRFGINLVMHVLTGNYKSDQVHVPALLDRLGQ